MDQTAKKGEKPPRILVVDDDESMLRLLSTYLKRKDYCVENCLDSRKVVEKIQSFQPDLIILDLMMPTLDGVSATRRIRNLPLESYLPIIMLTAKKEVRDVVTALEAGADDYMTKPFEFDELIARIRSMLRLKQLQDRLMQKTRELNDANQQIRRLNRILVNTNKQLQRKVWDFHNLFEVSYKVMGQLELEQLIRQALLNILGIFGTEHTVLLLTAPENPDVFSVADFRGFDDRRLPSLQISRHDRMIHYLEVNKKAFRVSEVPKEFEQIVPRLQDLKIEVVCPLFNNENVIGLLCLGANFKGTLYNDDDLEMLGILANMLAVAVQNAQMYEHIRALSYTDGMTGVHNYRFFRMRIHEEVARARREGGHISLLILDVDHFKNYNDTLGHPAGDEVLRQVSQILQRSVRDSDVVARYGGEEFAVILSGTEKKGAHVLAERIRVKIEQTDFFREEIQPGGELTISIGIATFPDDAVTEDELIEKADRALYHAKNTGRNRVVSYHETLSEA